MGGLRRRAILLPTSTPPPSPPPPTEAIAKYLGPTIQEFLDLQKDGLMVYGVRLPVYCVILSDGKCLHALTGKKPCMSLRHFPYGPASFL